MFIVFIICYNEEQLEEERRADIINSVLLLVTSLSTVINAILIPFKILEYPHMYFYNTLRYAFG